MDAESGPRPASRKHLRAIARAARAGGQDDLVKLARAVELMGGPPAPRPRQGRKAARSVPADPDAARKIEAATRANQARYGLSAREGVLLGIQKGWYRADTVLPEAPQPVRRMNSRTIKRLLNESDWPTNPVLADRNARTLLRLLPRDGIPMWHTRGYLCGMLLDAPWLSDRAAVELSARREAMARLRAVEWKPTLVGRAFAGRPQRDPEVCKPGATRVTQTRRAAQLNGELRRKVAVLRRREQAEDRIQAMARVIEQLAELGIVV